MESQSSVRRSAAKAPRDLNVMPSVQRFLSLDVFRGMTICFMIIVNTPGSGAIPFSPLEHAAWHGFTPTDLVFPSFLFAVGNAMSFSQDRYRQIGNATFLRKVIKRTLLIFLIGYLMYWFPFFRLDATGSIIGAPISHTRIMGVLQRIALCYFFASLFMHYLKARTVMWIGAILLLGYWALLLLFGDHQQPYSMLGNAGIYLDKFLMGNDHLYHGEGLPFDPEGWLSTLPAIVNVIVGYFAGRFIQKQGKTYETISKLMLVGSLFIFLAIWWNMAFPINKKIWSSPFVLLTTGIDLLLIAALIYTLELKNWNFGKWTHFFTIFGRNPLFIYIVSEVLVTILFMIRVPGGNVFSWINRTVFQEVAPGPWGSFLFAITYMLICWSVGWMLNKRKIYIRV
ncbi:MAG TPA: heparan-alpha-glucosaminide N-acetyltransferase domain-containing protein [Flavisolibacter sp.]|nr:heparan-alpha-glucosaminide N-acetyltransferase domain-containing protein [Flavisolibacter sp.]